MPHTSTDAGGEHLPGNVGGAWRVGDTVHRATGPWTPAVHALLAYLDGRVPHVPRVLGTDDEGREVLTYLPGRVVDVDTEELTEPQVVALGTWARRLHDAVAGFVHPGPWRFQSLGDELVGDDRWSDSSSDTTMSRRTTSASTVTSWSASSTGTSPVRRRG